jgi:hypothetical protein
VFWQIVIPVARPFLRAWMTTSARSLQRSPVATGAPQVHADGADADRILLVGDGPSVGHGVLSHELGLAGHLARRLSSLTGRGVDIDIVVSGSMTAANCLDSVADVDLSRFDTVILTIGANEARALLPARSWRTGLTAVLDGLESTSPASVRIFFIEVPSTRANIHFPSVFRAIVDRQVVMLNRTTEMLIAPRERVSLVPFDPPEDRQAHRDSSREYDRWAGLIAPYLSKHLDETNLAPRLIEEADEAARQRSLDDLGLTDEPNARIDAIVSSAHALFGTSGAAVTIIDHTRQWVKSKAGVEPFDVLRAHAFCDVAIRRTGVFVVRDAAIDPQFSAMPSVSEDRIRFYAGHPIEAPDGQRIGALCIIDTSPREFSMRDAALLRDLAIQVQNEIWESVPGSSSEDNPASRAAGSQGRRDRPRG